MSYRSASRAAAMPTTPSCHVGAENTSAFGSSCQTRYSAYFTASSMTPLPSSLRRSLSVPICRAIRAASASSAVTSRSTAARALPMRPGELIRGMTVKLSCRVEKPFFESPLSSRSARSPGLRHSRSTSSPRETSTRFSSSMAPLSPSVPRATRSSSPARDRSTPIVLSSPCSSLKATPVPVSSLNGYRSPGSFGLTKA